MGIFDALVAGMTTLINWLYQLSAAIGVPSYAIAIILLTVLVKVVLYPLTRAQMRSMIALQQIQPEVRKIQEKYKDRQEQQQKIMELYREKKVNPMAGCLPMLIQLPILIALYRALYTFKYAVPAHAGLFWIPSLSHTDPLYILPVLAGATTYIQSKLTMIKPAGAQGAPGADQTQKVMLIFMPLFITWISIKLPAGLALYWVTFNVMGSIQQYFINKQLVPAGAPAPAKEEVAEVAAEPGKQRKKRRGGR